MARQRAVVIPGQVFDDFASRLAVWSDSSAFARVWLPLLAGSAYYLGARFGFLLTTHPTPVSTLWPPNAILLAFLLLQKRSRWPGILAATFAAHAWVELESGVPWLMMLCWYVSNVSEAMLGVFLLKRAGGAPPAFASFRYVLAFMLCAFASPFLTSFLDAGFVHLNGWGQSDYWTVWRTRFFSNVLATLTIVPAVVVVAENFERIKEGRGSRWMEAAILASLLVGLTWLVFVVPNPGNGITQALVSAVIPVLITATLRFGPLGASSGLLVCALVAVSGAASGRGPFTSGSTHQAVLSVQLFLIVTQVSLLVLAAVTTERARAEEQTRTKGEQLRLALFAASVTPWDWDISGDQLSGSEHLWKAFGAPPPESGAYQRFLEIVHPDDRRHVHAALALARQGQREVEVEFRATRADGSTGWFQSRATTIYDERGNASRMVGVNVDITDRKRAEMEIETRRREVTHLSRVALVGELSVVLAHELKQPLTAILYNAKTGQQLLTRPAPDLEQLGAILDDIVFDDGRATDVITRLRALLRNEDVRQELLDVNDLVRESIRIARQDLVLRHISWDTQLEPRPRPINADRIQMQQTLLNLLINSCESMDSVPIGTRRLVVTTTSHDDGVTISIADSGAGIPQDQVERIFDPFVTTKTQGLGLGLSICRSIVNGHGGRIWADSWPGGATIHVHLPAVPSSSEAA